MSWTAIPPSMPTFAEGFEASRTVVPAKRNDAVPPGRQVHFGGAIFMPVHAIVLSDSSLQLPLLEPSTFVILTLSVWNQKLLMNPTLLKFWIVTSYLPAESVLTESL